jgi:hypothetical protein
MLLRRKWRALSGKPDGSEYTLNRIVAQAMLDVADRHSVAVLAYATATGLEPEEACTEYRTAAGLNESMEFLVRLRVLTREDENGHYSLASTDTGALVRGGTNVLDAARRGFLPSPA